MLRHILYLVGLSVVAVFLKSQLVYALHFLMYLHVQIANGLRIIFSDDSVGEILQGVLGLLLIPIVIGIVFALVHFLLKQEHFPHTMTVVWVCWAVLLVAILTGVSKNASTPIAQNASGQTQEQMQNQTQAEHNGQGQTKMAQNFGPDAQKIQKTR